ncbi:hypothetical protein, partial [Donghicola sp. XS_ASV15]|uniref:hypothetical protein n=1 Tax=Donghicola sp. XS_ASV15 TaxID=3241295 RepID=UPI0035182988
NRQPLHDGRGIRSDRQRGDRPNSQHKSRLIMTSGHPTNYTTLTDVTKADEVGGSCSTGIECAKVQLSMTARKGATQ